jgi:hypothetical protein
MAVFGLRFCWRISHSQDVEYIKNCFNTDTLRMRRWKRGPINFAFFLCPFTYPHATSREGLNGFSWASKLESFTKHWRHIPFFFNFRFLKQLFWRVLYSRMQRRWLSQDYTALYPRRQSSSVLFCFEPDGNDGYFKLRLALSIESHCPLTPPIVSCL